MKKIISIMLITLIMCFSNVLADTIEPQALSTAGTERETLETLIFNYYNLKCDSLKNQEIYDFAPLFNNTNKKAKEVYDYEKNRLLFFMETLKASDDKLLDYDINLDIKSIELNGANAKLLVAVNIENIYSFMNGKIDKDFNVHTFTLKKCDNNWLIENDEYNDEFLEAFGYNSDFENMVSDIDSNKAKFEKEEKNLEESIKKDDPKFYEFLSGIDNPVVYSDPDDVIISYDRYSTANYAYQYTDDTGSSSDDNYNPNFINFSSSSNDCQNFASQCVWAGFGGIDDPSYINSHEIPMMYNWWADYSDYDTRWTYIPNFTSLVTGNYSSDGYGVRARYSTLASMNVGDLIIKSGHIIVINDIVDDGDGVTEYGEIYICGHTSNRQDKNLKALYGGTAPPSGMQFLKITNFKYNDPN